MEAMPSGIPVRPKGEYTIRLAPSQDGQMHGIGRSTRTGESFHFEDSWDMIESLERHMDQARFPQNTLILRSWGGNSMKDEKGIRATEDNDGKIVSFPKGANFLIRVQYRQNATWQGTIQWLEGKQTLRFRSVLELLKLMEGAIEKTEDLHAEPAPTWE